jgi:hypothetical protein
MDEMQTIQMSRADIDELTAKVDTISLSAVPRALLSAILAAIGEVIGDQDPPVAVTVTTTPSLQDQFDTGFTPDSVDDPSATGPGVKVTVTKVGRNL